MLHEPPRSPYDLMFTLGPFPVRITPWFWILAVILGRPTTSPPVELFLWVGAVFVSILVHELGHALAFHYFGSSSHIVLYQFGGLAVPDGYAGFSQRSSRSVSELAHIAISFAGPAAGFLFAGAIIAAIHFSGHDVGVTREGGIPKLILPANLGSPNLDHLVKVLLYINILWGLVNLLPLYPLDGGQISRSIFQIAAPAQGVQYSLMLSVVTGGALAVWGLTRMGSLYMAIMFGLLAYQSFQELQARQGGGYGGRGW